MTKIPAPLAAKKKRRAPAQAKKAQAVTSPPRRSRRIQALQKNSQPRTEEPRTEEPRTEEPRTQEPRAQEPRAQEPQAQEPQAQEPRTDGTRQTDACKQLEKSTQPQQDQVSANPPFPTRALISKARLDYWVENKTWPSADQEKELLPGLVVYAPLIRQRMPLATRIGKRARTDIDAEEISSDQSPGEVKDLHYRDAQYEIELAARGCIMADYFNDFSVECHTLCQTLLTSPQLTPRDSLFGDDLFDATMDLVHGRNETKVIRDIAQLIVPSAELLAIRGAKHLNILRETTNACWKEAVVFYGPRPRPDYGLGFKSEAFSTEQRQKLERFLYGNPGRYCRFNVTHDMYFPFLTSEVMCSRESLDLADRQNAHSQAIQLRALYELFRTVGRQGELHDTISGFSVSHSDTELRIWAHLMLVSGDKLEFRRVLLKGCHISKPRFDSADTRWVGWTVTKNILDLWVTEHFKHICSAVDMLPSIKKVGVTQPSPVMTASQGPVLSHTGMTQQQEEHNSADQRGGPGGQLSVQHITPAVTNQPKSGNVKRQVKRQKTKP